MSDAAAGLDVAVIGAGLMGHAIAASFVAHQSRVSIYDPDPGTRQSAPARVEAAVASIGGEAEGELIVRDALADCVGSAQLVIEAAPEQLSLKQDLFAQLDALAPAAILATNTSVLRIGEVAARTTRPQRVIGTHWWNPPHLVPLVEVVQGEATADETVASVIGILSGIGKTPVHVRRDVPGFIGNRLQHAMWREAIALVEAGVCDAETVDAVVRNSFGLRLPAMGPLENADYVGLELTRAVHEYVFPHLSSSSIPSPLLDELIATGHTGAGAGQGFLEWPQGGREEARVRLERQIVEALGLEGRA
jgi:3-hydroxybutyryl-CoA dehydrogenase